MSASPTLYRHACTLGLIPIWLGMCDVARFICPYLIRPIFPNSLHADVEPAAIHLLPALVVLGGYRWIWRKTHPPESPYWPIKFLALLAVLLIALRALQQDFTLPFYRPDVVIPLMAAGTLIYVVARRRRAAPTSADVTCPDCRADLSAGTSAVCRACGWHGLVEACAPSAAAAFRLSVSAAVVIASYLAAQSAAQFFAMIDQTLIRVAGASAHFQVVAWLANFAPPLLALAVAAVLPFATFRLPRRCLLLLFIWLLACAVLVLRCYSNDPLLLDVQRDLHWSLNLLAAICPVILLAAAGSTLHTRDKRNPASLPRSLPMRYAISLAVFLFASATTLAAVNLLTWLLLSHGQPGTFRTSLVIFVIRGLQPLITILILWLVWRGLFEDRLRASRLVLIALIFAASLLPALGSIFPSYVRPLITPIAFLIPALQSFAVVAGILTLARLARGPRRDMTPSCPHCTYSLRSRVDCTCPECGQTSTLAEVFAV